MVIGKRQRHRYLAIVLLAELATILPRDADRVLSLLGEARIINDPRLDWPVPRDHRQNQFAYLCQHHLV